MSTLVVQERHLWLCLTDMKEQEKVQFLNAPVSQTGLFGDAVESCAQQFSAAQKQTEAIKHIMRRRKPAAASTPAAAPQPARRHGRPPVPPPLPHRGSSLPPCGVVEPVTDRTPSPSTSQAAVQDVDAETHFGMRPSPRLVCSDRPEGRVLSCLDPPATQAIPAFRVRGTGVSVQGPALRAVPVASRLHQSRGGGPCPPERTRCAHSQLPRRLAHTRTVSQAVVCTQGPGAQAPQPAGPSGQLGKEQTRANAEDLFSRHGVRFGQPNSTPHPGACSVSAELLQDLIRQDGGSTETLSEAPGAYGCSCGDSPARSAPYETASALALWPNPEVGVETRHLPGSDYTGLPQDRPWSDPSFLRAGVPLEQVSRHAVVFTDASTTGWGATYNGHAVSGVWTGPQLHWHINCLELLAVRLALSRLRGRLERKDVLVRTDNTATVAYINRQGGFVLPSHVATRPPPPPLESEASEVPSCHPHPRSVQSGSRRAVSSSTSRRVETPSPGGSADLGTVRSCSGRPVCISRNHPLPRVLLPN